MLSQKGEQIKGHISCVCGGAWEKTALGSPFDQGSLCRNKIPDIWFPAATDRQNDTDRRAQGKGERLTLQQVFCKKPSFPHKFMVTSLLSSISASSHLRGQSASCPDDQRRGERRRTEVLSPRTESSQLLQTPNKARPQTPGRREERGENQEVIAISTPNAPPTTHIPGLAFLQTVFPKSIFDDHLTGPKLSGGSGEGLGVWGPDRIPGLPVSGGWDPDSSSSTHLRRWV